MVIVDDQSSPLQNGEKYPRFYGTNYDKLPHVEFDKNSIELPLYGRKSIAKSLSIKTEVSTKLSNMLAISANAKQSSDAGKDASPFGQYNKDFVNSYMNEARIADAGKTDVTPGDIKAAESFNDFVVSIFSSDQPLIDNIESAMNYYVERMNDKKSERSATRASAMIPVSVNFTTNGISGLHMGQAFTIPEQLLPATYERFSEATGKRVGFVVVGIDDTISSNIWDTSVKANMFFMKDAIDYYTSKKFFNVNALSTGMVKTEDQLVTDNFGSTFTGDPGSNVTEAGSGGHPITDKDIAFANKHTQGVLPAIKLSDNTFKIQRSENLGKNGVRNWLAVNPEFTKTFVNVEVPLENGTANVKVRPEFAESLNKAFAEIKQSGLNKYIKSSAGGLAVRNVTKGNSLSFHAWGFAIDINASTYPYGTKFPQSPNTDQDKGFEKVTDILAKYGIGWLRNSDPMHFSIYEISKK